MMKNYVDVHLHNFLTRCFVLFNAALYCDIQISIFADYYTLSKH